MIDLKATNTCDQKYGEHEGWGAVSCTIQFSLECNKLHVTFGGHEHTVHVRSAVMQSA